MKGFPVRGKKINTMNKPTILPKLFHQFEKKTRQSFSIVDFFPSLYRVMHKKCPKEGRKKCRKKWKWSCRKMKTLLHIDTLYNKGCFRQRITLQKLSCRPASYFPAKFLFPAERAVIALKTTAASISSLLISSHYYPGFQPHQPHHRPPQCHPHYLDQSCPLNVFGLRTTNLV